MAVSQRQWTLGVRKFYDDMVKCLSSPDKYFLADTLVDFKSGVPRPDLAKVLTEIVLKPKANGLRRPDGSCARPEALGADLGWKIKDIERLCRKSFLARHNRPVVETPRPQSEPFSMDLSSAVLRQMSFIDKMVTLGWTEHGRFEEDVDTLTRCVVRYHAFLDLMASSTGKFVVPTLDIDLAWHTHQLLCDSYRKLFNIMGMVPDHDDKVTQGALSISYDQTAEAWQARFSVPYSVCGCPPPIKSNSANPITSLLSRKGKGKGAPGPVEIINHRPDLVSVKVVNADETHPSDHNSVALINPREENAAQAQLRRHELKRRCRDIGLASDRNTAKEGGWSGMISKRSIEHSPAFLAPVAYGTKEPFGNYGRGDCAVYSGAGIEGVSAAGECARGNGHESICGALFDHQRNGLAESILQGITMTGDKALMAEYGVKYHSSARAACGSGGHGGGSVAGNFTGFNG
ncbi:hypothetical protein FRB98_001329 [Tulasnella sp. 332]|nr:hypothetical protein FRB98_001329 [Tulasnella sp. 332]